MLRRIANIGIVPVKHPVHLLRFVRLEKPATQLVENVSRMLLPIAVLENPIHNFVYVWEKIVVPTRVRITVGRAEQLIVAHV